MLTHPMEARWEAALAAATRAVHPPAGTPLADVPAAGRRRFAVNHLRNVARTIPGGLHELGEDDVSRCLR